MSEFFDSIDWNQKADKIVTCQWYYCLEPLTKIILYAVFWLNILPSYSTVKIFCVYDTSDANCANSNCADSIYRNLSGLLV